MLKLIYPFFKFVMYRLGFLPLNEMHALVFENFLKSQDLNFLKGNVAGFLKTKIKKLINPCVHDYLKRHLAQNDYVILMSSSPDFLVDPLAEMLNIKECFSTNYTIDSKGKINGVADFLEGALKAEIIKNILKNSRDSFDKIIGFSDSIDDLPLLEICNKVYLVKPKRTLKKKFIQKSCVII